MAVERVALTSSWRDHFRPPAEPTRITTVAYDAGKIILTLSDGRELRVPLSWFPVLEHASRELLERQEIVAGRAIHWDDLDEDVSLEGLMRLY